MPILAPAPPSRPSHPPPLPLHLMCSPVRAAKGGNSRVARCKIWRCDAGTAMCTDDCTSNCTAMCTARGSRAASSPHLERPGAARRSPYSATRWRLQRLPPRNRSPWSWRRQQRLRRHRLHPGLEVRTLPPPAGTPRAGGGKGLASTEGTAPPTPTT